MRVSMPMKAESIKKERNDEKDVIKHFPAYVLGKVSSVLGKIGKGYFRRGQQKAETDTASVTIWTQDKFIVCRVCA